MSNIKETILILANPASGRGVTLDLLPKVTRILDSLGAAYQVKISKSSLEAEKIARHFSLAGSNRIIAMGGDGTINAVASGLAGTETILGVIPSGTGNDYAKLISDKKDLVLQCRTAVFGKPTDYDVGLMNNQFFFNMMGIGFDAEAAKIAKGMKTNMGIITYLIAVFKVWKHLPSYKVSIKIDRLEIKKEISLLAVGIGKSSGGGFCLTPAADPFDGKFDVCVIDKVSKMRVPAILTGVLNGGHVRLPEIKIYRCQQVEIFSDKPLPYHLEGEVGTCEDGRMMIRTSAKKLKVAAKL